MTDNLPVGQERIDEISDMPNEYSVEIHNYLTGLINQAKEEMTATHDLPYWQGRLDELKSIRQYLSEHIDLKDYTYYE